MSPEVRETLRALGKRVRHLEFWAVASTSDYDFCFDLGFLETASRP